MARSVEAARGFYVRQRDQGFVDSIPTQSVGITQLKDEVRFGLMPVGTVFPIMTNISGAYAPPASGVVQDGFMVCDGAPIPPGMTLSGSVPDLTDNRFLMGATTAGITGGATNITPTGTVSTPTYTGSPVAYTDWAAPGSYTPAGTISGSQNLNHSHSQNAHIHGTGPVYARIHLGGSPAGTLVGHSRVEPVPEYPGIEVNIPPPTSHVPGGPYSRGAEVVGNTATASPASTAGSTGVDVNFANASFSGAPGAAPRSSWFTPGNFTPAGTVSTPTFTGNQFDNRPLYISTRYLIRVK